MFVLQYFCKRVTKQVRVALTSAGPAVQMTCTQKNFKSNKYKIYSTLTPVSDNLEAR